MKNYIQPSIFDEISKKNSVHTVGYGSDAVIAVIKISYRQLDYWTRTKLIKASVNNALGSGNKRLYSFNDILQLKIIKSFLDAGITLQKVKAAINQMNRMKLDLSKTNVFSNGKRIYVSYNAGDVVDVLANGQGVFAVSVGHVYNDLESDLTKFVKSSPARVQQPTLTQLRKIS